MSTQEGPPPPPPRGLQQLSFQEARIKAPGATRQTLLWAGSEPAEKARQGQGGWFPNSGFVFIISTVETELNSSQRQQQKRRQL